MKRLLIGSVSIMLLAVPGVAISGESSEEPRFPAPSFGPVSGVVRDTLAHGVVSRDGVPSRGAEVTAMVWPDAEALSALPTGATVRMRELGTVRTDSSGEFTITARPDSFGETYVSNEGSVDVTLNIHDRGRLMTWDYTASAAPAASATTWSTPQADMDRSPTPADIRVDLGSQSYAVERHNDPRRWVGNVGISQPTESVTAQAQESEKGCCMCAPIIAQKWHYGRSEHFMAVYGWKYAKATVRQSRGVNHTLGIGGRGSGGHWSASGTKTLDMTRSATHTQNRVVNANVYNKVNYRDFRRGRSPYVHCGAPRTWRRPMSQHAFFTKFTRAHHPIYRGSCNPVERGGNVDKDQGKNLTYGFGVDIGPISVSAQSGYSNSSQIYWRARRKSRICTPSRKGWLRAARVEVRRR